MTKLDPNKDPVKNDAGPSDLARRLARYRGRVEAEGRKRSVGMIDRAIQNAGEEAPPTSGKLPKGSP